MKTKICPYCGKELSAEAVLCKFCHNLLIDEDGKVTEEESLDDRTRVFTKPDDDRTKRFVLPEAGSEEKKKGKAVIAESDDDEAYEDDNYDDFGDEEFDDDYEDDAARKRLFAITAVITVGILIIVIAAILIGMRLFGQDGGGNKPLGGKPTASQPDNTDSVAQVVEDDTSTGTGDLVDVFIPENNTQPSDESAEAPAVESETGFNPVMDYTSEAENEADTDSSLVNFVNSGSPTVTHRDEDDSASEENANSQPEVNISDLEETVRRAVAGNISGEITGSQFRSEENGYAYYYFFTENGAHGYSVAYNINTGSYVCEQNY